MIDNEKYREILKRNYFNPSYLDNFSINGQFNLSKISVVIPTYNRAPHPAEQDSNPLGWCLESLLTQKHSGLDEIIIVDDASTDYTEEIVSDFSDKSDIPIVYLRNSQNLGSSISRNIGVRESKNNLIMFLDDDCVFSRYMLFGANYTLNQLDENVAALHLPVYHRKTIPNLVNLNDIGILDLKKGIMTGNYDGFPIEYIESLKDNFLNQELKILKPIQIKNLAGVFLIKKEMFKEIGGFPEFFTWRNGYREETNVALKLTNKGYKMFFTPDPKFHCVHLKYGAQGNIAKKEKSMGLEFLIEQSNIPRVNTGNRVGIEEWFFDRIISDYVTLMGGYTYGGG